MNDDPPAEELEMAVEEATGRPFSGKPNERIEALRKRIGYLESQINSLQEQQAEGLSKLSLDLLEARRQLEEWKALKGHN